MTLNDTYVSVIGIKEADERMKKIREIYEEQSSKISNMPDRNSGLQITSGIANFKSKYFGRISDWGKRETIINALTVVCCVFDQTLFECSIQKNERTGAERIEFIDCMFKRCHFNDTLFENVTFKNCIFIDCTLGCRKWKSVRMSCCLFDDKCRFNAADLMNVDVTMTNLIDLFKFGCFESCKTDGTILSLWESGIYLPSGLELKETEAIQEDEETEEDKFDTVEVLNSTIELFSQALANSNNLFKVLIPNDYPAIERSVKTVINLLESNKVEEKYKKVNKKEFWSKIDSNRTSGEALKFNDLNLSGFDFTCHQLKNISFENCDCSNCRFNNMLLYNVSFPYTDLTNADLTGVQLYNSKLDGALNIAKAIMSEQLRENLKLIGVVIESSSATNTQVGQYPSQQVRQVTNNDFRKGYPIQ